MSEGRASEDQPMNPVNPRKPVPVNREGYSSVPMMPDTTGARVHPVLEAMRRGGLPENLIRRLSNDMQGNDHYRRVESLNGLSRLEANSSYVSSTLGGCFCCKSTKLVHDGEIGRMRQDNDYVFLAPGYHSYCCCGNELHDSTPLNVINDAVRNGPMGFVTITEGNVGVVIISGVYYLLPPGTYEWTSPMVLFESVVNVRRDNATLGPYSLITVPNGDVAITYHNGNLRVLGAPRHDGVEESRTFFLDDPKWTFSTFISTQLQTDRLEGNDLLSKDNVELLMVAMSQWRVVDAELAVIGCAGRMSEIREKVNQLVRATIARIVAGTNIGAGPVGAASASPVVQARVVTGEGASAAPKAPGRVDDDDADLSHLMRSEQALAHMAELRRHTGAIGVEVFAVYVPEKRMKNDDIRSEIARQAVIGIKADAERAAADAKAYATIKHARAEAEAIEMLAAAHADAGQRLGAPETTASRLALSETMSKAIAGANLTVFSGAPDSMPFMFGQPPAGQGRIQ